MTTTIHAIAVPSPPTTANSGMSTPRIVTFPRLRYGSPSVCFFCRSAITEACAIVNESIAPNEYIVPRKSTLPGSRTPIEITPANTISDSHGVLKRGCSRRKTSGSCR